MSNLRVWPDPILSQRSEPIVKYDAELADLIAELLQELYASYGRGLAAPQIGVLKRVFVVDASWKNGTKAPRAFVNPEILARSDRMIVAEERCLSLPGQPRRIARVSEVELRWHDSEGNACRERFSGFEAVAVQHEIDHLDGITILDHPEAC